MVLMALMASGCGTSGSDSPVTAPTTTAVVEQPGDAVPVEGGDTAIPEAEPVEPAPVGDGDAYLSEAAQVDRSGAVSTPGLVPEPGKAWFPGTYLPRHCTTEDWDDDEEDCRADLMLKVQIYAEVRHQPESSKQVYGISQYLRIFKFLE